MANVTITLDDELLKSAKRVALERDISLTELIRRRLKEEVEKDESKREEAIRALEARWARDPGVEMGRRTWTREDLYDR